MRLSLLCAMMMLPMLAACGGGGEVGNPNVPEPSKEVDLKRYMGTWYEIGRYENRFEKGCEGVTATYNLRKDGMVDVVNSCRKQDGTRKTSDGTARLVENSGNAKLKVSFFGPFYVGDYWVMDHAPDYRWAIVGEPSGKYLWLLSRKPKLSDRELAGILARAQALGYDLSRIRYTKH